MPKQKMCKGIMIARLSSVKPVKVFCKECNTELWTVVIEKIINGKSLHKLPEHKAIKLN